MKQFVHSIRGKVVLTMTLCAIVTVVIGAIGVWGIVGLARTIDEAYAETTRPVVDISAVRSAQLYVRVQLRRIEVARDAAKSLAEQAANMQSAALHFTLASGSGATD